MNAYNKLRIGMAVAMMTIACGNINAGNWRWHRKPHRVVVRCVRPVVSYTVNNQITHNERFSMVMAYLNQHEHITINKYAKMAKLSKATAEAELDAFAMDRNKPIMLVKKGKTKIYKKR